MRGVAHIVETGVEEGGDAGPRMPFLHGRARVEGARVPWPGSPCMLRFADRPCMSLKALEPASPLSNLSGERISPARKRASSRTLRSKFSRLPGPPLRSGRFAALAVGRGACGL